ncbi:hypothetical protein MAPG_07124 [Magnaporthiopsis poae ATCC 64411]|uniref:Uncharacterized protein n=1 Tax=Magnaporthiopsis poae (strain ATCC 64411 / 73-15) TaxID=644358 RepID=A0A0C4E3U9_MAGP6|nr:hypothetical protein MAPG_07124 [Magnaporthiopsis poae ATCC 64411]
MKRRPIDELIYEALFPRPRPSDPHNFQDFLTRHLIAEVRHEVHAFYGHIDDDESKYPGLDYCHPTHRIRLSRWQWHRRLFRAFDLLRLTNDEIYGLTKWEGTKWAKERYEKESGITIRDTTADGFTDWIPPERRAAAQSELEVDEEEDDEDDTSSVRTRVQATAAAEDELPDADESEDEVQSSVGVELNERLRQRVAAHNAGDTSQPLDEEWEQWLKNAIETGEFHLVAEQITRLSRHPNPVPNVHDDLSPARVMGAARAGRWHEVPHFLHDMIGRSLSEERAAARQAPTPAAATPGVISSSGSSSSAISPLGAPASSVATPTSSGSSGITPWRRNYSELRLPDGSALSRPGFRAQPTGQTPGA